MMFARAESDLDIRKNQSYLAFFAAVMAMTVVVIVLYGYDWSIKNMLDDNVLLLLPLIMMISVFIFTVWFGFTLYTESVNNGEKATKRFWKRYKMGELPELYLVSMKNYEGEVHLVFHFTDNSIHPLINVYIPLKTATKLFNILNDDRILNMGPEEIKREVRLSGDEMEALMFVSYLLKTQGDRLVQIMRALKSFEKAEIDPAEYLKQIFKERP